MPVTSSSPPAGSWPAVDASRAQPRTDNELRAERETISQPRNVLVSGGSEALVNKRALLDTHRLHQAVIKQVGSTSARLQAPLSPSARAAAQALAKPAPNFFERLAQAVSTAYHENRANSAASDLAKHIKSGRFDAGSVDLLASLTQHAAHRDPASAAKARSHPAVALLQSKLAGADGDTLVKVRNSPVFADLKAANARAHAANEAMLGRLESLGFGGSEVSGLGATQRAGAALQSNRHLDNLSAILGAACSGAHAGGAAGMLDRIDQQSRGKVLGQIKAESALATEYPATDASASSPLAHLGRAQLSELSTFIKARFPAEATASQGNMADPAALNAHRQLVRSQALDCEKHAGQMLTKSLNGLSEPARRQALLGIIAMAPATLQDALQPPQGNGLRQAFNRAVGGNPVVAPDLGTYLQRGALRMLGGANRVEAFGPDGMPSEVNFGGQRYQFDRRLGNGANGIAVRYSPMDRPGPGIVLKATCNQGELGPGVADRAMVAKVGKEFANHLHAMGEAQQGHPNLLQVKGVIVAHPPDAAVRAAVEDFASRPENEAEIFDKPFAPDHLADSVSLFTVMEEAGAGPEDLVKDINQLRLTGAVSEATHGLLMRSLFAQMVEGCAHLEDRQIAHRDLKLENMLLSQDGRVLIMDLGEGDVGQLTQPAPEVGTPMTQSPELLRGSGNARKVDTWALGVIWRQMSNSLGQADPRETTVLDQEDRDPREWPRDSNNAIHKPERLSQPWAPHKSKIEFDRVTVGNLDGVEQLTNAMLHPDQEQRPTLAALRNHHAIADPALQDPRLGELILAIRARDGDPAERDSLISRLDQELASTRQAFPEPARKAPPTPNP